MTEKDTSVIPAGIYCYDEHGRCPYWRLNIAAPEQMNGYCEYLELGDWMEDGTMLLWDQCKECGINKLPRPKGRGIDPDFKRSRN